MASIRQPFPKVEGPRLRELYGRLRESVRITRFGKDQPLPATLEGFLEELVNEPHSLGLLKESAELTPEEAASLLRVDRKFVLELLEKGEIRSFEARGCPRIRAGELLAFRARRDEERHQAIVDMARPDVEDGTYFS